MPPHICKTVAFLSFVFLVQVIAAGQLSLLPPPWPDGERLEMKIISPEDCKPLGHLVFSADTLDANNRSIWRIESNRFFSRDNTREFTRVDALRDSFIPVDAITRNKYGDYNTAYGQGSLTLKIKKDGRSSPSKTRFSEPVYDKEQILHLVRRLPLKTGYKTSLKVFSATDNTIARCRIEVADQIENLNWAKGLLPCFVIDIKAYVMFIKVEEHRLWISTDARRLPLKHIAEDNILELTNFYTALPKK